MAPEAENQPTIYCFINFFNFPKSRRHRAHLASPGAAKVGGLQGTPPPLNKIQPILHVVKNHENDKSF